MSASALIFQWGMPTNKRRVMLCAAGATAAAALMVGHAARLARGVSAFAADAAGAADANAAAALGVTELPDDATACGSRPQGGEHRLCDAYGASVTELMQVCLSPGCGQCQCLQAEIGQHVFWVTT